jgi:peptide/nickel transport system permease protein
MENKSNKKAESNQAAPTALAPAVPKYSETKRIFRVFFGRKLALIGSVIILLLIITGIFAPLLAPYKPDKLDMKSKLLPLSSAHLLGTDALGRDTFSHIIYGTRTSLEVAIGALNVSTQG